MAQKISNTKKNLYEQCPAKYDYYYNKKIRSKTLSSALFFGVALDEALNVCLENFIDPKNNMNPFNVFYKKMTLVRHNDEWVNPSTYKYSRFSKSDLDIDILTEDDYSDFDSYVDLKEFVKDENNYRTALYNRLAHTSLVRKGEVIIQTYIKEVIPQLHTVLSVQERMILPNEEGDSITGVIDFIASFKDSPNEFYIIDNKTASKPYTKKDLEQSEQLHLYAYYKELNNIAYIVCEKNIRKKEPRVRITIMKGRVDPNFSDKLLDRYENLLYNIKNKIFPKNIKSGCKFYGEKCEYFSLCHFNTFPPHLINRGEELVLDEEY